MRSDLQRTRGPVLVQIWSDANMPEQVTFDSSEQLIHVHVVGTTTIEEMASSKKQILRLHKEHGVNRTLVNLRDMLHVASMLELYEFGKDWPNSIRAAILVGDNAIEEVKFLETVAFNRGKELRVFEDEEAAKGWLGD